MTLAEHLSAFLLVHKLDAKPRTKKYRPILREHLPSYPALITKRSRQVIVDFPDFLDLRISGSDEEKVIDGAKTQLLRTIVGLLCDGGIPPTPSLQESIENRCAKSRVEMISPL